MDFSLQESFDIKSNHLQKILNNLCSDLSSAMNSVQYCSENSFVVKFSTVQLLFKIHYEVEVHRCITAIEQHKL